MKNPRLPSTQRATVARDSRHIRWNFHKSPDLEDGVRYHFVIVDDKQREGKLDLILRQLNGTGELVQEVRRFSGTVAGSKLGYLFYSGDTRTSPNLLDLGRIGTPVRDKELYDRQGTEGILTYVDKKYNE